MSETMVIALTALIAAVTALVVALGDVLKSLLQDRAIRRNTEDIREIKNGGTSPPHPPSRP